VTIDAIAIDWLCCPTGRGGGGGGCHAPVSHAPGSHAPGPGLIGGRASGGTHAGGMEGSRGSHCVSISDGVSTCGPRMTGFQFGSTGGDSSSISMVPSSEQKVSQGSVYCRLHCGQYFIYASNQFQTTKEVGDFNSGVFV
jgi:hypothetical protein